jgi:hypothetical protein
MILKVRIPGGKITNTNKVGGLASNGNEPNTFARRVDGSEETLVVLQLADGTRETETKTKADALTVAGVRGSQGDRGRAGVLEEIVTSRDVGGTGDGGSRRRGVEREDLPLLAVVLMQEHEETGKMRRRFDGRGVGRCR